MLMNIWNHKKHWLLAVVLGWICTMTFFNSLHNDFMMDDYGLILQESTGHDPARLIDQFIPNYRGLQGVKDNPDNVYYRPWAHVLPLGCYMMFQNQPLGYHVVNLVLFWLAGLCVYGFVFFLFRNMMAAFFAALFFIIHPINGLTVNYITASVFSLQVIATLLGLMAAIKSVESSHRWGWVALGFLGFINALFCHETALAFPFYVTVCLLLAKRLSVKDVVRYAWPFWVMALGYFIFRLSFASLKASIIDKVPDITIFQYLATFAHLIVWYFKCLLTLQGIVLIWSTEIVRSREWIGIFVLAGLLAVFVAAVIRLWKTPYALWLVWIMIGFLPVTLACFFQPRSGLMIEPHWLIIASIGFFSAVGHLLSEIKFKIPRVLWLLLTGSMVIALVASSLNYNRLWGNEEKYCRYWHQETPRLKSVFFYLAGTYFQKKDWPQAKEFYQKALENEFLDYEVFNNLGLIAMEENDVDSARDYFIQSLKIHPNSSIAMTNLGAIALKREDLNQAEEYFRAALDLNVHLIEPRLNLAKILQKKGRLEESIELYRQNDAIDPMNENNLYDWWKADLRLEHHPDMNRLTEKLLSIAEQPEHLTQIASTLAQMGMIPMAQNFFEKVLRDHPDYAEAYLEAGKMLGNLNDFDGAIRIWEDGFSKFPQDPRFSALIQSARGLQQR